ncbi:MAG: diguanylate cyclase [Granulosicoccus sp.]
MYKAHSSDTVIRSGRYTIVYLVTLLVMLCALAMWTDIIRFLNIEAFIQIDNAHSVALFTAISMVAGLGSASLVLLSKLRKLETAHGIDSHAALHDSLTGIANRRQFEIRLGELLEDRQPSHTLLMVDLDRFKPVNDLYGHAAGDALLREISLGIKRLVHHDDLVARLGGDEFALLLTGKINASAEKIALDVLQFVTKYRLAWEGQRLSVGASIGLVSIDHPGQTSAMLLTASDEALYAAKEAGRGAVFAADFNTDTNQPTRFRRIDSEAHAARPSADSHVPEDGRTQQLLARVMTNLVTADAGDRRRTHGARRRYETRHWISLEPTTIGDEVTPGMLMRELINGAAARSDGGADFARWAMAMALDAASRLSPVSLGRIDFVLPMPARAFVVVPELADELMRSNALAHSPIRHITFILHGIAPVYDSPMLQKMHERFKASDIRLGYEICSDSLEVLAPLRHIQFDEIHLGRELIKKLRPGVTDSPTIDALLAIVEKTVTSLVAACVDTQDEVDLLAGMGVTRFGGPATGNAKPIHTLLSTLVKPEVKRDQL